MSTHIRKVEALRDAIRKMKVVTDVITKCTSNAPAGRHRVYGDCPMDIAWLHLQLFEVTEEAHRLLAELDVEFEEVGGGDKEVVREYFNNSGFQRWKKIYGETDDVNKVQPDIRLGHSKKVENAMAMLTDEGPLKGVTVSDARCGTGSLAISLAKEGAIVLASDISAAMVAEAKKQAEEELSADSEGAGPVMPKFEVKDLESLNTFMTLGLFRF
ncbi:hypothetical protein LWI29_000438 [Acer saccharum]|uniref:Methyltransferase domain-containing protein n=1 Tax=Acer saccharum TaxID=4024 RepID=A0AA39S280_ACESA|nr:hypothetical protein LWI29_000438 [Acer saccharum]